jgi:hypothetical protein
MTMTIKLGLAGESGTEWLAKSQVQGKGKDEC